MNIIYIKHSETIGDLRGGGGWRRPYPPPQKKKIDYGVVGLERFTDLTIRFDSIIILAIRFDFIRFDSIIFIFNISTFLNN